jgi:hypothetical protein
MANGGSDVVAAPSLTLITMFENVPTFASVGVPASRPVLVLKLAHDGRFEIENRSLSPSASDAVGWKLYACPAMTLGAGEPEIVGGVLAGGGGALRGLTTIRNGPIERESRPSVTVIVMSPVSPTCSSPGEPVSAPVSAFNCAHAGTPSPLNSRKSLSASLAVGVNEYIWPASTDAGGVPLISGG